MLVILVAKIGSGWLYRPERMKSKGFPIHLDERDLGWCKIGASEASWREWGPDEICQDPDNPDVHDYPEFTVVIIEWVFCQSRRACAGSFFFLKIQSLIKI